MTVLLFRKGTGWYRVLALLLWNVGECQLWIGVGDVEFSAYFTPSSNVSALIIYFPHLPIYSEGEMFDYYITAMIEDSLFTPLILDDFD